MHNRFNTIQKLCKLIINIKLSKALMNDLLISLLNYKNNVLVNI